MADLSQLLSDLQQERQRKHQEVRRLDDAIDALKGVVRGKGARFSAGRPRRRLSVAARRRIAAAQRARWAKVRAQKKAV